MDDLLMQQIMMTYKDPIRSNCDRYYQIRERSLIAQTVICYYPVVKVSLRYSLYIMQPVLLALPLAGPRSRRAATLAERRKPAFFILFLSAEREQLVKKQFIDSFTALRQPVPGICLILDMSVLSAEVHCNL